MVMETGEIWSEKKEMFIKYDSEVSSRVSVGECSVVDFGELFTETNEYRNSVLE